jgi:hypothetical protein
MCPLVFCAAVAGASTLPAAAPVQGRSVALGPPAQIFGMPQHVRTGLVLSQILHSYAQKPAGCRRSRVS